jgi:hypothetical protein
MGTRALVDSFTSTTGAASYSKDCALGAEAADRVIVVEIGAQTASNNSTLTCTIGGTSATLKVARTNNRVAASIFYLPVPTGTTATIQVSASSNFNNVHFAVHRLTGIDAESGLSGSAIGSSTAASLAVTLNPVAAGVGVAVVRGARASHRVSVASSDAIASGSQTITADVSGTDSAITWTGLTEDTEEVVVGSGSSVQVMAAAIWYDAATVDPTVVTADNSAQSQATTSPTATPKSTINVDSVGQGQATTSPLLSANNVVAGEAATQNQAATSPTVEPKSAITVIAAAHAHSTSSPTISTSGQLNVNESSHSHITTSPALQVGSFAISVSSAAQLMSSTSPLVQTPAEALPSPTHILFMPERKTTLFIPARETTLYV